MTGNPNDDEWARRQQSLNPYESSYVDDAQSTFPLAATLPHERRYAVRFTWSDRLRFMQSVGPLRVAAAAGIVASLISLYNVAHLISISYQYRGEEPWNDVWDAGRVVTRTLRG